VFVFLAILLLFLLLVFLDRQKTQERRVAIQRELTREQLLPQHYKSFIAVEKRVWAATEEQQRSHPGTRLVKLPRPEARLVREYVQGLRKDFKLGNRIFGAVIVHSPETKVLARLEWQRAKIEFSYYCWYALISFRLWTGHISPVELQRFTQVVSTLAYEVRSMLSTFEQSGAGDFVESILRNY
jgi:hypothetical protein